MLKILVKKGHKVLVQKNGGFEAGFYDEDYKKAGANIINELKKFLKNQK